MRLRTHRGTVAVLAATAVTGIAAATTALAAPSPAQVTAGRNAATWLTSQVEGGVLTNFGMPDIGLTIDVLLALEATGVSAATAATVTDAIAAKAATFSYYEIDYDGDGDDDRIVDAGSTAKLLVAAVSTGRDPKAFGGLDLDAMTRRLIATSGPHRGRVRDTTPEVYGGDASNTFDQSLAVLGLVRSGGVPQDVVTYLIKQQCPAGGFRLNPDPAGASCAADDSSDVDSTGMAVQALLAAGDTTGAAAAAAKGAAWLKARQGADGSFVNGPQRPDPNLPAGPNSNSTGLAGQALAAAGYTAEADKAAAWVAALQLTSGTDSGALAYEQADFAEGAIDDMRRDRWRRATAQALLTLAQVPLGELGRSPSTPPSASASAGASAPPSASASASASSPASASASASGSAPGGASVAPSTSSSTAPGGRLPVTGQPIMRMVAVAVALVTAGAVLLLVTRRRRSP
ncbi:cell wall anchor protein [Dactylosporangium roseum]|uniref:Cell wall anchor protein n=1 Tax=Dactylosporangium roseum TaxID=47989 RepID=A0ABY5ZE04_9ACTN|nr:cell wall anchor protein [Dactylosporangium roseum]UWZ38997.1 cell wall anchor protein [Dactylosporangium roseum]